MKIKFWGIRGSIPVPGKNTVRYGGNTPCVQLQSDDINIILDAGTGLRELGNELIRDSNSSEQIYLLISHTHWDHIQGIPFFLPFFRVEYKVKIFANTSIGNNAGFFIDAQMNPNFFPVSKEIFKADFEFIHLQDNSTFQIGEIKIDTIPVNHSKGTLAYKFTKGEKKIVYMTDNEIKFDIKNDSFSEEGFYELNKELIEFCRNADVLIHDCMYNEKNLINKIGWGHSNNISVTNFGILADVKNLVLFHYDPDFSDSIIDKMLEDSLKIIKKKNTKINCIASVEGLKIEI